MAPRTIAVEVFRAKCLSVGSVFPWVKLVVSSNIAVRIRDRDLPDVEIVIGLCASN